MIKIAIRRLWATPVFTALAVVIIALGIGANTAIFTAVNAALFRPLPFQRSDRIVHVYQASDDGSPTSSSFPAYRRTAEQTNIFSGAAAFTSRNAGMQTEAGIKQAVVEYATSTYLPLFGLQPSQGRWFTAEEDRPGAGAQAVLSHRVWQTRYGSDPNVLGSTVRLNGASVTIVGIGPESYNGAVSGTAVDFWLSLSTLQAVMGPFGGQTLERPGDHWFQIRARLRDGVTTVQASEAMNVLSSTLATEFAGRDEKRAIFVFGLDRIRFHPSLDGVVTPAAAALMGLVGLVLALACSNIAILLLIRGAARARDVSIRVALGASRRRILREFLIESVLLSSAGGVLGALTGMWSLQMLSRVQLPPSLPINLDLALDLRVLAFAMILSLVSGVGFGLAPAFRASRTDVITALRDGGSATSRAGSLLKNAFVVVQVALSVVLLVGTGLVVRSLINSEIADAGFAFDRLALIETNTTFAGYTPAQSPAKFDELQQRFSTLRGVEAVTRVAPVPVSRRGTTTLIIENSVLPPGPEGVEVPFATVGLNYFDALDIPILHGRAFDVSDGPGGPAVAIVSETLARKFWGTSNVVGRRFRSYGTNTPWVEVVGVARDTKVESLVEEPRPLFYRPWRGGTQLAFLVRTTGDARTMAAALRRTMREYDSALPVLRANTFAEHLGDQLFVPRVAAAFLGGFSVVALALAALGLYAVVAFSVAQRRMEVGIRMALGAGRLQVLWTIGRQVLLTVFIGLTVGFGLALVSLRGIAGMLYQVSAADPLTLAAVGVLLAVVATGATFIPAFRAASSDPVRALRL